MKRHAVRFTIESRPDTLDPQEVLEDAADIMLILRDSWYSSVRIIGEPVLVEWDDEDEDGDY